MRISDWSSDVCSSDLQSWRKTCACGAHRPPGSSVDSPNRWPYLSVDVKGAAAATLYNTLRISHVRRARHAAVRLGQRPLPQGPDLVRRGDQRSEEHTSELQSLMRISYAVFCLTKT